MLRVDHPDILEFIGIKLDPRRMVNFNLSVAVTDAFMEAVKAGTTYDLVNPRTGIATGQLDARRVLDAIANAAWAVGDPGMVFIDRINALQPTPALGVIEATNPCGEQPLLPFESCTLGSIDVGKLVRGGALDWDRLRDVIHDAVHFLDDVIDANRYPLPEIERATKATRKIGLGIMGWADALVALEIPYDAPPALELAAELAAFLEVESLAASAALAERRGAFPAWPRSRWYDAGHRPLRNATTTTIAPTGTISIIAGCASGIEPLYALAYRRNVLDGAELLEINPAFQRIAAERGFSSPELFSSVVEHGGVRGLDGVPDDVQRVFVTAHEVDVATHVRMQAAFQRHVHAAVSKTINLARSATALEVKAAYELAYELGCKGITVYRDGSREGQVLVTGARVARPDDAARCPECGAVLVVQSRCRLCRHCGWSVCG
jgi:ribonucleoside-diphosphate reductase alpha chain